MTRRSKPWDQDLSFEYLKEPQHRRGYFLGLIDEGFSWRESLKLLIKRIGLKEYAELSGFQSSNLLAQLSEDKDIRLSTLEKMVAPLGVSIGFNDLNKFIPHSDEKTIDDLIIDMKENK